MPTDHLSDPNSLLGEAFLARRLRRLSDIFVEDTQAFLRAAGITCPARALPTLMLLAGTSGQGIVQIAKQAGLSHPLVIDLLAQLEGLKLVRFVADKGDRRRRLVFLTAAGEAEAGRFRDAEPVIRAAYAELSREIGVDLWQTVNRLDDALAKRSYAQRLVGVADIRALLAPRSPQ